MKAWADIGFEIEGTDDGSLSLRQLESVEPGKFLGESMHHSGGAWAETLLIYGAPIRETLEKVSRPHFMIVGLGMGYIELVIAREALLQGKAAVDVGLISSYESIPELRQFFYLWIHNRLSELHPEVVKTYDSVMSYVIWETNLKAEELKQFLQEHFKKLEDLHDGMTTEFSPLSKYHCILYDAFSSKTTPFLWEEEFLKTFLTNSTADDFCLYSTYACRVSLKNALKETGFEITVRPGFRGKRNSTLGTRRT